MVIPSKDFFEQKMPPPKFCHSSKKKKNVYYYKFYISLGRESLMPKERCPVCSIEITHKNLARHIKLRNTEISDLIKNKIVKNIKPSNQALY